MTRTRTISHTWVRPHHVFNYNYSTDISGEGLRLVLIPGELLLERANGGGDGNVSWVIG